MKNIFTLCLVLFSFQTFSQNYRTIVPGAENFFENSTGYIKGIRAGNVQPFGTDSVSYQFYSILDTVSTYAECIVDSGPSWIGHTVLLRNDGYNIFFNVYNDSIFINTVAEINGSWRFYTYPNGDHLDATVTNISYDSVGVNMDSVKTISLQAKDSTGNNISNPYDSLLIKISKNHGFISIFPFVDFPNDITRYQWINIHRPTIGEIYNFNIGDTLQSEFEPEYPEYPPTFYTTVIQNKYYSSDSTTVYYEEWNETDQIIVTFDTTYHSHDSITYSTGTISFTNLDTPFFAMMPEETMYNEPSSNSVGGGGGISYYQMVRDDPDYYCGRLYMETTWGWLGGTDSCYMNQFEPILETWGYAVSLGNVYYDFDASSQASIVYSTDLIYYSQNNDSETCGEERLVLGINELSPIQNSFSVFPNPCHDKLTVQLSKILNEKSILSIVDIYGQEIRSIDIPNLNGLQTPVFNIDVSSLASGIYFITLKTSEGIAARKIVVE